MGSSRSDTLSTSAVARAVGVHPNTVRLYEAWGFISPAPRAANGYRQFGPQHVAQMRLARHAMQCTWLGGEIRRTALAMLAAAAAEEYTGARDLAGRLRTQIQAERRQADSAAEALEQWVRGAPPAAPGKPLQIGQVAQLLEVGVDALRNWENNGLIQTPRDPANGYRRYGPAEIARLRVIRMLLHSRYSTMAILRMLLQLDAGEVGDLRRALDTPRLDEDPDALYVSDRWLSALAEIDTHTQVAIDLLDELSATFP